ncbi:MAG: hypothetical protein JWQ04_774 [Pedosphaera sp.]|nr:hypothetical protein [Pedosphaera sp.]
MGGTGNLPVPVGWQQTGTSGTLVGKTDAGLQVDVPFHSAGLVAQRHGQVARATRIKTYHPHDAPRRIARGGWFRIPRLINRPVKTVKPETETSAITSGNISSAKCM